jgi:hypothetical protein
MTTYTLNRLPYREGISLIELEEIGTYESYNKAQDIADALDEMYELDLFFVTEEQDFVLT